MQCPKCPGVLKEVTVNDVKVDVCWVCEGIWFDKNELEQILKKDACDFRLDNLGQPEFDGKEIKALKEQINSTSGFCPRCREKTTLKQEEVAFNKRLIVDICPHGHGIWLDGGEIHLLRERSLVDVVHKWQDFKEFIARAFERSGPTHNAG